jgi:hypothetical protein
MKRFLPFLVLAVVAVAFVAAAPADKSKTYNVTADTIEGCSCPLFCTCYFGPSADEHMCQFNIVYKFREGSHYGNVDFSNQKVWLSGDLGGEWHQKPGPGMPTKWATVTFDKGSTKEQRDAIGKVVGIVFPVKWGKLETREDSIEWHEDAKTAHTKLASGFAELKLDKKIGPNNATPTAVKNIQYWFTTSNDGFNLAYSTHHFNGENKFSHEHRNGFTVSWTVKGDIQPEAAKVAMK